MASAQEHGTVRINFADESETRILDPVDFHTSRISGGALAVPTSTTYGAIPFNPSVRKAGRRLVLGFVSDAADTIESEECDSEIDVLLLDQTTLKVVGKRTIKLEAMTGFKPSGTVDLVAAANVYLRVAHYDAPTGQLMTLDPAGKTRVYVGDDTA